MLTPEIIAKLAPRALAGYVTALSGPAGWAVMKAAQISTVARFAGFLANVMEETAALTVIRESLNYSSPARLRAVWPKRFGTLSDDALMPYVHNEKALARAVYDGRMGNVEPDDGYTYRGWGLLQCTGRTDTIRYCALAGVDPVADPTVLDDPAVSLVVACAEWSGGGCNAAMDAGNFPGACAIINVGNITRVAAVVGLSDRIAWYRKISNLFASEAQILDGPEPVSSASDYDPTEHSDDPHWTEVADDAAQEPATA